MVDRDITISNLETNIRWIEDNPQHQFPGWGNVTMAMRDAVELLKEHEAAEPKQVDLYGKYEWLGFVCVCPYCKAAWMSATDDTHFCPNCGRKVKWDDNRT